MLQEYKVILPTGFETTMLMTEEYKDMFYPDAVLVDEVEPETQPKRRARHRVAESNDVDE